MYLVNLVSGKLYKNGPSFYIHGSKHIGESFVSEDFSDMRDFHKKVGLKEFEIVQRLVEWTEYISLLTPEEVVKLFIKEINDTSVELSNITMFLDGNGIRTNGLMKLTLDDCMIYREGRGGDDCCITLGIGCLLTGGSSITNSTFIGSLSNNRKEFWPTNQEFDIKVNKNDVVINSYTDKRGYIPTSCGKENAGKIATVILRGRDTNQKPTNVDEINNNDSPIPVSLYDTEHAYGFDYLFMDKNQLKEFLELNPRFELQEND
jgi:hypothetical protein